MIKLSWFVFFLSYTRTNIINNRNPGLISLKSALVDYHYLSKVFTFGMALSSFFCCMTARAASVNYTGTLTSPFVSFSDNGSETIIAGVSAQIVTQIAVNPTALSLKYDILRVNIPSFVTTKTESYTAGFGLTKDITTTITFNAATYELNPDVSARALTPGFGGAYGISNSGTYPLSSSESMIHLSGSYTVTGPTQSVSNTFDLITGAIEDVYSSPDTLNTAGYPNNLELSGVLAAVLSFSKQNIVDVVVDDLNTIWGVSGLTFSSSAYPSTLTPGTLSSIPEPSTYALFVGLASLGVVSARRRKITKK